MNRKPFYGLVSAILILSLGTSYGDVNNILSNPGFENGSSPSPWTARGSGVSVSTVTSSPSPHSGYRSGRATGRTATWHGMQQNVLGKMVAGQTYTVSGWLRTSTSASSTIHISFEQTDGSGTNYYWGASGTASSSGWVQISGNFTLNVTGTLTTLNVYLEGPASGVYIYADDVNVFGQVPDPNATGNVNINVRHQVLDGFGAAGAWYEQSVLNYPPSTRTALYNTMFGELGLDIYRVRNTYDIDNGYITRSAAIIAAAETSLGHPIRVMNSSWSPPAYLKSNNDTVGGTLAKDGGGNYRYADFAQWWRNSLNAWTSAVVNTYYVNMQNEPDWTASWDTCYFKPTQTDANAGYKEAFAALYANLNTMPNRPKLLAPEGANIGGTPAYVNALNATDKSNVYGYSHHLYDGDANNPDGFISPMTTLKAQIGDRPLLQTEFSRGGTPNPWTNAMNLAILMHNALTVEEVSAYLYWELFWASPSGLVSLTSPTPTINSIYYAFKHFSAFTDPNWQRVDANTSSTNLRISAFISPDNSQLSAIIINTSSTTDMNLILSFPGFTIVDGNVWRSTSTQNCVLVGPFANPLALPKNSITTVALSSFVPDITPPAPPEGLSATAGAGFITLDWNDNNEADLAGYNVYRSLASGSGYVKQNTSVLTASDYFDANVTAGTPYYYVVTALDTTLNESYDSNEVWAVPNPRTDVEILGSWISGTSHTKETGTSRALVFFVHAKYANTGVSLDSVTYGGQTMTKIIEQYLEGASDRVYIAAFILNDAGIVAADNSGTFNPSWTGSPLAVAYSSVFLGTVDQTVPVGDSASAPGTDSTVTTSALSTTENDLVIDAATASGTGNFTLNNGFIEVNEYTMTSSDGVDGYKDATGVAETPSVTHAASRKVLIGFVVQAGAPAPPNNPPTVSITSPSNGTIFAKDANITIDVNASDSDGTVTKVEFFEGTTKLGEDTNVPYSYTWNYVPTGVYVLTAKATDDDGNTATSSEVNITVLGEMGTGAVLSEWWTDIPGTAVSDLTSDVNYPDNPSGKELLLTLQGPTNWNDNYGTRIRGYLNPVTSGDYTFWIAADDSGELWLSSDDNPANVVLIASTPGSPQSSPISLVGGQKYYIEVLHKEGTGNDNISVSWQGPGIDQQVINGVYLSACCLEFRVFAGFANQWNFNDCTAGNDWCEGFDLNRDGSVLTNDLKSFVDAWLAGM